MNEGNIVEGSDVYFDCIIDSNPSVYKVEWFKNVRIYLRRFKFLIFSLQRTRVSQDLDLGIIVSSSSLVLQSVRRESSGEYTCTASNIEGDATSNPQTLLVKCKFYKKVQKVYIEECRTVFTSLFYLTFK